MKVAIINTYYKQGGAAIAALRLQQALNENGIDATLINKIGGNGEKQTSVYNGFTGLIKSFCHFVKERLYFLPHEKDKSIRWNFSPANTGSSIIHLPEVLNSDILHIHWTNHGFLSIEQLNELLLLNKPVVFTLHDMWLFTGGCHHSRGCNHFTNHCGQCHFMKNPGDNDLSYKIHHLKQKYFSEKIFTVITPSHWLAKEALKSSLLKNKEVNVIPNAIDTSFFFPEDKATIRIQKKVSPDEKVILFIAANAGSYFKGVSFLIDGLNALQKKRPDEKWKLVVAGRVKDEAIYHQLKIPYELIGSIADPNDMRKLYSAADVFVLPSLEENLPNTIIESMACGTPAVAFDIGGVKDIIDHKKNGYVASYKDANDLAAGIEWVFSNGFSLSTDARKKIVECFSKEAVIPQVIKVYQTLPGR